MQTSWYVSTPCYRAVGVLAIIPPHSMQAGLGNGRVLGRTWRYSASTFDLIANAPPPAAPFHPTLHFAALSHWPVLRVLIPPNARCSWSWPLTLKPHVSGASPFVSPLLQSAALRCNGNRPSLSPVLTHAPLLFSGKAVPRRLYVDYDADGFTQTKEPWVLGT